jgi:two-component system, OmpR family, heavy metal sensor histidine kinase CusS
VLPRLSLTHRLTLFFTLVASSVVLGLGGLFMAAADQHFVDLDRGALQDKQHLIGEIIASSRSSKDLDRRLDESLNHHQGESSFRPRVILRLIVCSCLQM